MLFDIVRTNIVSHLLMDAIGQKWTIEHTVAQTKVNVLLETKTTLIHRETGVDAGSWRLQPKWM
jgi:hypothetical protein